MDKERYAEVVFRPIPLWQTFMEGPPSEILAMLEDDLYQLPEFEAIKTQLRAILDARCGDDGAF